MICLPTHDRMFAYNFFRLGSDPYLEYVNNRPVSFLQLFVLMHPQLSDKKIIGQHILRNFSCPPFTALPLTVCREFIQALEECHSSAWRKFTGGCNKQKNEMNHCLRTEVKFFRSAVFPD